MTSAPLYDFTVPLFTRAMKNLLSCMDKAEAHAKENNEDVEDYTKLQIHPDMKPFGYQIQRISDTAKFIYIRVTGADGTQYSMPDEETKWSEFRNRLTKTIEILEKTTADEFQGKENVHIELFGGKFKFTGMGYVQSFAIPNFYFHVTTAYDILRMKGVPVGKSDYLSASDEGFGKL